MRVRVTLFESFGALDTADRSRFCQQSLPGNRPAAIHTDPVLALPDATHRSLDLAHFMHVTIDLGCIQVRNEVRHRFVAGIGNRSGDFPMPLVCGPLQGSDDVIPQLLASGNELAAQQLKLRIFQVSHVRVLR
jgi:hypothetical protein